MLWLLRSGSPSGTYEPRRLRLGRRFACHPQPLVQNADMPVYSVAVAAAAASAS